MCLPNLEISPRMCCHCCQQPIISHQKPSHVDYLISTCILVKLAQMCKSCVVTPYAKARTYAHVHTSILVGVMCLYVCLHVPVSGAVSRVAFCLSSRCNGTRSSTRRPIGATEPSPSPAPLPKHQLNLGRSLNIGHTFSMALRKKVSRLS